MDLDEAKYYSISYRAIKNSAINIYTDKSMISLKNEVSFDIDSKENDALDYFAASIIGSIITSMINEAKRYGLVLEDVEVKITITISNPLNFLKVKGYEDKSRIESCDVVIYYYCEREITMKDLTGYLERSLIYNSLKDTISFTFRIQLQP